MGDKNMLTPVQAQLLKPLAAEELYDLQNDPYETVNLIGNEGFDAVHKELKEQMTGWIESSKDKGVEKDSDAIVKHFREYGISTMKKKAGSIQKMRSSVEKHFE
jgi:hypothetical protein